MKIQYLMVLSLVISGSLSQAASVQADDFDAYVKLQGPIFCELSEDIERRQRCAPG